MNNCVVQKFEIPSFETASIEEGSRLHSALVTGIGHSYGEGMEGKNLWARARLP